MALVTCPDCQTQLSDAAAACPKCGRPMAVTMPTAPSRTYGLLIFGVVLIVLGVGGFVLSDTTGGFFLALGGVILVVAGIVMAIVGLVTGR